MFKKILVMLLAIILILSLSACSKEEKKVVIASKPMTEQYIIVEMLTLLIEANTDITVEQKMGIGGGTQNIHPAMLEGEIDIYPEYTGTGWMQVLKQDFISNPMELYASVKDSYMDEYNIIWSELYGFNDTYGLALDIDLANELGIKTYSDLATKGAGLRFGAEYDFFEREDGYKGLQSVYGIDFEETVELDIGLKYQAIGEDEVDLINIFSTDGRLKEYNLLVLEDDLNYFPSYFAATLIRNETLEKYPELKDVLKMLDGQLTNIEMTNLNYLVEIKKEDPLKVATEYLKEKGLLD